MSSVSISALLPIDVFKSVEILCFGRLRIRMKLSSLDCAKAAIYATGIIAGGMSSLSLAWTYV